MQKAIICPACNFKAENEFDVCPRCGVIIAKYYLKLEDKIQEEKESKKLKEVSILKKECPKCRGEVHLKAEICPHCKHRLKTGSLALIITIILSLFLIVFIYGLVKPKPIPQPSVAWNNSPNPDIARVLFSKHIKDCGEMQWQISQGGTNEYFVKCIADGEKWTEYIVWTNINEVTKR